MLRIEKGLLTHAELHGRTTAFDLGLGRMVWRRARTASARRRGAAPRPAGPGARAARRPAPARSRRAARRRRACARRRAPSAARGERPGLSDLGLPSRRRSATTSRSPSCATAGRGIGATVRAVCRLRGLDTACEIVAPPLRRSRGRAAAWLSSSRAAAWAGLDLPADAGAASRSPRRPRRRCCRSRRFAARRRRSPPRSARRLPEPGRTAGLADGGRLIWAGLDLWLLRGPRATPALAARLADLAAVTDQSDGWTALTPDRAGAAEVLARLVPIDLDARRLPARAGGADRAAPHDVRDRSPATAASSCW